MAMRSAVLGLAGAAREVPSLPASPQSENQRIMPSEHGNAALPTLLGNRGQLQKAGVKTDSSCRAVQSVSWTDFRPDLDRKLGSGAYGFVYPVEGSPDKVVKLFSRGDWSEVVKESSFARDMKAHDPEHFVNCLGIGVAPETPSSKQQKHFAVFEKADGIALSSAAHRFHSPDGIDSVGQALNVLEQLIDIMTGMMTPDANGQLHFHLDLKADNIMMSKTKETDGKAAPKITLIDYGVVTTCSEGDPSAQSSVLQMFRWLGWEMLWMLSSEHFRLNAENPWDQLPEGFFPFFQRSEFRPPAYQTQQLSPDLLKANLEKGFFDAVLSPAFRGQWSDAAKAQNILGKLIGDLFYGVALASDCKPVDLDFKMIKASLQELQKLANA